LVIRKIHNKAAMATATSLVDMAGVRRAAPCLDRSVDENPLCEKKSHFFLALGVILSHIARVGRHEASRNTKH